VGPAELVQAVHVATQHYVQGRTKMQIAAELGISRYKVARVLDACLAEGIVRIEISPPRSIDAELSEQLRSTFRLHHVLVVNSPPADVPATTAVRQQLGEAAADLLAEIVTEEDVLGVAWGRTLQSMATSLRSLPPCRIVQMTGVTGAVGRTSVDLLRHLAAVSGGPAHPIYAPLVVSDEPTSLALHRQHAINSATSRFASITKATVAIGSWDAEGSQLHASLGAEDLHALAGFDIAAEVCATLLASDGTPINTSLHRRTIAISARQLRHIPEVIAVAGGVSKARAIHTVLRGGLANSLVTDQQTAAAILALGRSWD